MIRNVKGKYVIYGESGERLSKPYSTYEKAADRLRQIEYFKHKDKKKK